MNLITLSEFFNNLSNDLINNKLTNEKIKRLENFYTEYIFREQCDIDISNDTEEDDVSIDDIMKFYTMGWYVYSCINNNNAISG